MSYLQSMEEPWAECPYNKQHRMRSSKLPFHIVKCMKNYPDHVVCPYNAYHRMLKSEYADHVKNCPDKFLLKASVHKTFGPENDGSGVSSKFHCEYEDWSQK